MGPEIANSVAAQVNALLESAMLEDGLGGVGEIVEGHLPGMDPVAARLAFAKVLIADVAQRLAGDSPFGDEIEAWEQAIADAHAIMNQISAVRARCVAEYARRDDGAADELAPVLRLGTYEADRLVHESTWMVERAPKLLDDVAHGSANLATVAAIAGECRDARPETCERVDEEVRRRGVHRAATKVSAGRSARTLVERYETAAARVMAKKTAAQQTGVWLDPHPTPGLALLSAVMPSADAEAIMTAIEDHATTTHRANGGDGRVLGEHRAAALGELALRNVTLTAHLELIGTTTSAVAGAGGAVSSTAPVVLASKVGPIAARDLARVLAAHAGGRDKGITVSVAGDAASTYAAGAAESAGAYRPPKAFRESVIRRDGHCRFPGCPRPAKYTDLDHVIPWPNGPHRTSQPAVPVPKASPNQTTRLESHHEHRWHLRLDLTHRARAHHPAQVTYRHRRPHRLRLQQSRRITLEPLAHQIDQLQIGAHRGGRDLRTRIAVQFHQDVFNVGGHRA